MPAQGFVIREMGDVFAWTLLKEFIVMFVPRDSMEIPNLEVIVIMIVLEGKAKI